MGTVLVLGAVGLACTALTEAPGWPPSLTWPVLAAGLVLAAAFVAHIRRHPAPLVAPRLFSVRRFSAGAVGLVTYYTGFAAMLLGMTLLLTVQWHFSVLQAAASIAPGPITAGIVSPFSGRLAARFGVRGTVVTGAVLFAAAGAWPLASAGDGPAYAAVVLPSMLLWGVANALIQPSLFACADAEGIHRFTALVSAGNQAAAGLLRSASADPVHREHGTVEWEIPLVPAAESGSDRQRAVGGHDGRGQGGGSHEVAVGGGRCATALCERPHQQ